MPSQIAAANVYHFMRTSPVTELPEAPDPVPAMRRELTLLRIEVEHLRAMLDEARKVKQFLSAYVESVEELCESRDQWQREAERLKNSPVWQIFWSRCLDFFGKAGWLVFARLSDFKTTPSANS